MAAFWTEICGFIRHARRVGRSSSSEMRSRVRTLVSSLVALAALACAGAAEAQVAPAARRVLDRARVASGGAAWSRIAGVHEMGSESGARYERWADPLRFGVRTEIQTPAGRVVRAYNGAGAWSQHPPGVNTAAEPRPDLGEARSDAFFAAYGYLFPSRFDVRASYVGARRSGGRAFEVIKVQPNGGAARELWFDRRTGLLGRMIQRAGGQPVTVEMTDYRRVGPVTVPFRFTTFGGGAPRPQERVLDVVEFKAADRSLFSLPRPRAPGSGE